MTDHDKYVIDQVRKTRKQKLNLDLSEALGATRGPLAIEDVLEVLANAHGFEFPDAVRFFCERQNDVQKRYAAYAHENLTDEGSLEIDATAMVSLSDDRGAYVMGWVWVDQADAGVTEHEQEGAM